MELFNGLIFTNSETGITTLVSGVSVKVIEAGDPELQRFCEMTEQAILVSRPGFQGTIIQADFIQLQDEPTDKRTKLTSTVVESGGVVRTDKPSANGAGSWKLGKVVHGTAVLKATDYIEAEIDGVFVKLAIVS